MIIPNPMEKLAPLDTSRELIKVATELDMQVRTGDDDNDLDPGTSEVICTLDGQSPYLKETVIVHGRAGDDVDDDEVGDYSDVYGIRFSDYSEKVIVAGTYLGFQAMKACSEYLDYQWRIVHVVETDRSNTITMQGHLITYSTRKYILAEDSEIFPVEPVDYHSYVDLKDDEVVADIDVVLLGDREVSRKTVEFLGSRINPLFGDEDHPDELMAQRVSYLNSLRPFESKLLKLGYAMLGNPPSHSFSIADCEVEFYKSPEVVYPGDFAILPSVYLASDIPDPSISILDNPAVHIRAYKDDGTLIFAPLNAVRDVIPMQ